MARLYKVMDKGCCTGIEVQPKNGKAFTLEEAQAMVGGYIEVVHLKDNDILVCDEEGRLKDKERNEIATFRATQLGYKGNEYLVGDVLFCKDNEI